MLPSAASQLVALGMPYALEEQGRFLAGGLSALTVGADRAGESEEVSPLSVERLGQLGRATEALVSPLDARVGGVFRTPDSIFFGERAVSGWTIRLALVLAVVPFALGVVDLIVRSRRRGLPFRPSLRAQRARLGFWIFAGALLWLGSITGLFQTGAPLPLPPSASLVSEYSFLGLIALAIGLVVAWLVVRERLVAASPPAPEERLAGLVVALALLGCGAVAVAIVQPYALLFVLPSLYAWLWMPLEGSAATRLVLYMVGLLGPAGAMLVLAHELQISILASVPYVVGLATVGYLSPISVALFLVWIAAAAQVGALALGRYRPYAGGVESPPPGPLRRLVGR
jgi:hypothetical protein